MPVSVTIPARFNGPTQSGNGGYSAGAIAALLDAPAAVTLRQPVPLDTPLDVVREEGSLRILDGEATIAEAEAVPGFDLAVPPPVGVAAAREASTRYRGLRGGEFSRCFVCGRDREDSLGVFAGAVEGRDVVASAWTPPGWTADEAGHVRSELVWAVLDCPTFFAAYENREELPISFLARFTGRLDGPVTAGEEHVVMAWPIEADGRKHTAGSAVLSADGEILAVAHALLIEPRR